MINRRPSQEAKSCFELRKEVLGTTNRDILRDYQKRILQR